MSTMAKPPYMGAPTVNIAEVASPMTEEGKSDRSSKKTVTITATCSRPEVRRLMQATTDELQYVDFSVVTKEPQGSHASLSNRSDGTRLVIITASCPANEVGRLMEMASDTLGSVNFTVCPSVEEPVGS